ncbi:MAG TPA: phospho-sugar mutase [Streptosporangiaceae bacterium]|nr:phospho-sugar mutase [Streptosporangiaceae bacterium]
MTVIGGDLRAQAERWIAGDPDERDRAELRGLLDDGGEAAAAELADRFGARLEFGTAGLRGAIGAGPNRMNRAVVRAATAALARWLAEHGGPDAAQAGVVIGCDARHRSGEFADEAARVLAGAGIRAHLLPAQQPTPLLAFSVRHLRAAAGIMITASHNPPADNGYKLYLGDGAQIIPPVDKQIGAAIAALGDLSEVPVAPADSPVIRRLGDETAQAYLDAIVAAVPGPGNSSGLRVVYTPLHGVAAGLALRAFERAGFPPPHVVAAQAEPDPAFPTVAFPNPEEPGALDLALALAEETGADLVVANDPDGDRLAIAVPDPAAPGGWRALSGDQVGALLGAYLLEHDPGPDPAARLAATTVVSSTMLSKIAAAAGARYAETLTGFKWIVRAADGVPGARFVFGYEEALGYAVSPAVRDKDGISAALVLLSLAATARAAGQSLLDRWDALEAAHGVHLTTQVTLPTRAPAQAMAGLRARPPAGLADLPVTGVTDLGRGGGVGASTVTGTGGLPPSDVLTYHLPGARVVIRPSGTEPKLKAYLEVTEPVGGRPLDGARAAAAARLAPLRDAVAMLVRSAEAGAGAGSSS